MTTRFRLREVLAALPDRPTYYQLARLTGLAPATLRAIRDNKAVRVDLATLDAIARALGCEAGQLLDGPTTGKRTRRP